MKSIATLSILFVITLASCSTAKKSYFTVDTRKRVEEKAIPMEKLQFYVDKDVELRRELASRETKVTSGKVILENGKYVNIILLKAGTFGVCTRALNNNLDISFESGDNKNIRFGVPNRASSGTVYSLFADQWVSNNNSYNRDISQVGKVVYDGELYYLHFTGDRPKLLIQKSAKDTYEVNKRVMGGRKVN